MKLRWKILIALVMLGTLAAFVLLRSDSSAQKALARTQQDLRQQGFKTELSEFDFSISAELRARAAALTNAVAFGTPRNHEDALLHSLLQQVMPESMQTAGADCAVVLWKREKWPVDENGRSYVQLAGQRPDDLWPLLRESFNEDRELLDAACAAALGGPIRFDLDAKLGQHMLLRHLGLLRILSQSISGRMLVELHYDNRNAAWTNLLTLSCLVTAWSPEPVEVSHLVRFVMTANAYDATWQALQAGGWNDERLVNLQREWETVDFFKDLPETAAFWRASAAAACQQERQQPIPSGMTLGQMLHAPRYVWPEINGHWQQFRYHNHGSYEDEKNLLLYQRDREVQLRLAVEATNWLAMSQLPGVTNFIPFQSKYSSRVRSMLNMRQISLATQMYSAPGQGRSLLGRASDAESRRRLIITAIALERYHGRQGVYPKTLSEFAPDFLKNSPTDFMDGQPLRYRLGNDGHFVLYSVGLDCTDNGGEMQRSRRWPMRYDDPRMPGVRRQTDLVWPRPASAAEVQMQDEADKREVDEQLQAALKREADEEKQAEAARQATVKKLLAEAQARKNPPQSSGKKLKEQFYEGKPLSKLLRNEQIFGQTQPSLDELLTAKQIIARAEPDIATFELPIRYDVVTNIGGLRLLLDADPEESSGGRSAELQECGRATNGNCLLIWNTTYDPPGQHAVQAEFYFTDRKKVGKPFTSAVRWCRFIPATSVSSILFTPNSIPAERRFTPNCLSRTEFIPSNSNHRPERSSKRSRAQPPTE